MTDTPPFPDTPEDVTAEWLTAALRTTGADAAVTAVEERARHAGTTGRLRLALTHAPGHHGPASVFVKLAPFEEGQRKLVAATDMGRREARFYAELADDVPLRVPRCHYAAHGDERTEYVMVLEDLEATGCRFTDRADPGGAEHAARLIEGLGRLHAHFWEDPRFDDGLDWVQPAMRGKRGAQFVAMAKEQFAADSPPVFAELCDLYVDHADDIVELWDEGERTLVHGDTHAGNQFVDGDAVGLYDWAVISRSPGVRDVAIYLGNSCDPDLRREHEGAWLATYRRALVEAGVDAPPADVLHDRYRRCVLYAWIAATTTAAMGSRWQPIEVGMAGMARATTACADLDTLGALRDAL